MRECLSGRYLKVAVTSRQMADLFSEVLPLRLSGSGSFLLSSLLPLQRSVLAPDRSLLL